MAWDTEQTRHRLLEAAADEFAEHGFAGARIDRIGVGSGVNKQRIYSYFGNKVGLFDAVITRQLTTGLDEIPLTGTGPESVATFAGDYFDASVANPRLARLTAWEGLERNAPVGVDKRSLRASGKVAAIQLALPHLETDAAQDLLLTIVALVHAWTASANLGLIITGSPDDNTRRRRHVVAAVRAISKTLE
ncbi:TetR/AcrR family transcriptional regulator [Cryobacterium melibiosiphilum]|uniref:TetR/AcrR family transcriptional regulator n=1 Tax=Cryobacterium melibiosiphilum TaxID=995039 RepID=A0A3A5MNM5_9MICO|nr:TetR family transcriptional regulator [Cryobacterium melibiosiphilum]RJT87656.1 TetR/AcrR family transcriptional regulator [Cryobacterium melibiosiphilum]